MPSKYRSSSRSKKGRRSSRFLNREDEFHWSDYAGTLGLATALTIIYAVGSVVFGFTWFVKSPDEVVYYFGMNNYLVIARWEWYRILSSAFVHAHLFHLAGNLLFLVVFGLRLEELKGIRWLYLTFLASALGGNLLTLAFFWDNPNLWSLGASGGVQGLFSANIILLRKQYSKGWLTVISLVVVFGVFTLAGPQTNAFAHLGGLVTGGLAAYALEKLEDREIRIPEIGQLR